MKFLGHSFQKLQREQHGQIDATERITTPHSRAVAPEPLGTEGHVLPPTLENSWAQGHTKRARGPIW